MLTIRDQQLAAMSTARIEAFVRRMRRHFQVHFADWSRGLEDWELTQFVRSGVQQAHRYGFSTELEIAMYMHVMQALGSEFVESSEYRWAAPLLAGALPSRDKLNRLQDAADFELEARRIRFAR